MQIIGREDYELYNLIKYYKHEDSFIAEESVNYEYEDTNKYEKVNNMHDKLFRDLLNNKKEMKSFLNKYLKLEIEQEELEKYNSSFITNKYKNKESDIIYRIKNENIFFLIEHQSKVDKTMPVRLMEYSIEIIRSEIESVETYENKFPKVIPIVLYTGEEKWSIEKEYKKIEAYIGYAGIEELGIDLKYNLIDINDLKIEELIKEETLVSKAIIIEKSKTKEEMKKYLEKVIVNIKEEQKDKMEQIMRYMIFPILKEKDTEELIEKMYENKEREVKGMNLLVANLMREEQELKRKARKEGESIGEKRGERKGIRKKKKKMKEKGLELSLISAVTGLKIEEI